MPGSEEALANYARPWFLFANLLVDLPFPGMELWTRFRQELCADYLLRHNDADAANRAPLDIGRYLTNRGSSLSMHGLPESDRGPRDREVNIELDFFHPRRDELRAAAAAAYETMNPDQGGIFDPSCNGWKTQMVPFSWLTAERDVERRS
jgi:hypothetical protein